jgi:quercetin dioxygenase-like cupin family protein
MAGCDCVKSVASGNLAIYQMTFKRAGEYNEGHAHSYHHFTLVASGEVEIETIGSGKPPTRHAAGAMVWIPRGVAHRMRALEAFTVVYCIHALHKREDVGDVIDDAEVPGGTPDWAKVVPLLEVEAREIADFRHL